mmetsp:Transcript_5651/g.8645  ORF Transcript_5651/g.8645 Transcript_5651/m.8645 type:complete len:261 (-) Transcript_5651:45-827(-)
MSLPLIATVVAPPWNLILLILVFISDLRLLSLSSTSLRSLSVFLMSFCPALLLIFPSISFISPAILASISSLIFFESTLPLPLLAASLAAISDLTSLIFFSTSLANFLTVSSAFLAFLAAESSSLSLRSSAACFDVKLSSFFCRGVILPVRLCSISFSISFLILAAFAFGFVSCSRMYFSKPSTCVLMFCSSPWLAFDPDLSSMFCNSLNFFSISANFLAAALSLPTRLPILAMTRPYILSLILAASLSCSAFMFLRAFS